MNDQDLIYVAGAMYCPKCGFECFKSLMNAETGGIFVDDRPHIEECSNDEEIMERMTWQYQARSLGKTIETQIKRAVEAEELLDRISSQLCGVKVEGEVKRDMVYSFVEGEIEKQSDLKEKAETKLRKAAELINEGIKHYKENYQSELQSCDRWIKWCKKRNDTHGENFHGGMRSAFVWCNIILTKFLDAAKEIV